MESSIKINNAADISVIVIYFLLVLAVGLWVGWDFILFYFILFAGSLEGLGNMAQ